MLTPDNSGTGADLFLKDMLTGAITRAPLPSGTFAQNLDNQLTMRADGQYVAFVTTAGLSPLDRNNASDVYGLSFSTLASPPAVAIDPIAGDDRLNAMTISSHLAVSGTSDAIGQSVAIYVDGSQDFTALVGADGTWSGAIDATALIDGVHQVRATVANAAGATNSAGDLLSVDRVAPTVALSSDKTSLSAGQTATITAAFSEGIGNVTPDFFTATGGVLSQIQFTDDHTLTALFTPDPGATTFAIVANPGDAFDYAGNPGTGASLTLGKAFDGTIVGGAVSYLNGSGGGVTATTQSDGSFALSGGDGPLALAGGVDSATGLPFTGAFTAPAGATVLSPLTTLLEKVVESTGDTISVASAAVDAALGIAAGSDLTTLDAVVGTRAGDAAATAAFLAGSKLYDVLALVAAAGGSANAALGAFAADVASGAPLNLIDAATVAGAASAAGLDASAASAIAAIAATTGAELAIQLSAAASPEAAFVEVTGASIAEQGDAAAAIAAATQAGTSLSQVAESYAGDLADHLAAADSTAASNVAAVLPKPAAPTIVQTRGGADRTPVLTGSGEAGATIALTIDGTTLTGTNIAVGPTGTGAMG